MGLWGHTVVDRDLETPQGVAPYRHSVLGSQHTWVFEEVVLLWGLGYLCRDALQQSHGLSRGKCAALVIHLQHPAYF